MTYRFDPELQPWIVMLPDLDIADLQGARDLMAGALPPITPPEGVLVHERHIPGPDDAESLRVLVFEPSRPVARSTDDSYHPSSAEARRPAVVYFHGGGFVLGSPEGEWDLPSALAAEVGALVVSVDYRLAPEHPFPAGVEDCYAAVRWVAEQADVLGIDRDRIAVGGMSAGAGLAAATCLLARDRGGPRICFQLLELPVLDDRLDTASMHAFTDTPVWHRPNATKSWEYYLGARAVPPEAVSPYAAPARAQDLAGLPPAYLSACEFDPLRDEGLDYAVRLIRAGVPTEVHHFPGTFHGSGGLVPSAAVSQRMREEVVKATRTALDAASTNSVAGDVEARR